MERCNLCFVDGRTFRGQSLATDWPFSIATCLVDRDIGAGFLFAGR